MRIINDFLELHENVKQAIYNADDVSEGRAGILNYIQYNDLFLANGLCTKDAHDRLENILKNSLHYFKKPLTRH